MPALADLAFAHGAVLALPSPALTEVRADAWERIGQPGRWLLTCEHASHRVPAPLRTNATDRSWLRTHWGHDIGARTFTRELLRQLWRLEEGQRSAPAGQTPALPGEAVLARFSRLVCDANRDPAHPDLVRIHVEGTPLSFNQHLAEAEVMRRVLRFHDPYHQQLAERLALARQAHPRPVLLSIHSFTPVWNRFTRPMDIGVLFDRYDDHAQALASAFSALGLRSALNEPYSGREGLIYAANRHGEEQGVEYLELELNQALILTPGHARALARRLAPAISRVFRD